MNTPEPEPIRLGRRHCCACTGVCYHIGPVMLCDMHKKEQKAQRRSYPTLPERPNREEGEAR